MSHDQIVRVERSGIVPTLSCVRAYENLTLGYFFVKIDFYAIFGWIIFFYVSEK